jgi:hypothetical protein
MGMTVGSDAFLETVEERVDIFTGFSEFLPKLKVVNHK